MSSSGVCVGHSIAGIPPRQSPPQTHSHCCSLVSVVMSSPCDSAASKLCSKWSLQECGSRDTDWLEKWSTVLLSLIFLRLLPGILPKI